MDGVLRLLLGLGVWVTALVRERRGDRRDQEEPRHSRLTRRACQGFRTTRGILEVSLGRRLARRRGQVDDRVTACQRGAIAVRIQQVPLHDMSLARITRDAARPVERDDFISGTIEFLPEQPSDKSGAARQEDPPDGHDPPWPDALFPSCSSMMYIGRGFTSLKMRPRYSPRMPRQMSCTLPRKSIATMMVAQPSTV